MNSTVLEHLKSYGFYVIPNYLSKNECKRLRDHIDNLMLKYPEKVQCEFRFEEGNGGDRRMFGLENTDDNISRMLYDENYLELIKEYSGNKDAVACTALGGKVEYVKDGKFNSGGDWHRDPGTLHWSKVKMITYLSDVSTKNGPLIVIPNTRISDVGLGPYNPAAKECDQGLFITHEFVDELLKNGKQKVELPAEAGTLILVDVSNIHMGKVIEESTRYSLTNYFQRNEEACKELKEEICDYYMKSKDE